MTGSRLPARLLLMAAAVMAVAACETEPDRPADAGMEDPTQDPAPAQQQADEPREIYEARLAGVDGRQITGVATVTVYDDELQVVVAVDGLEAGTQVPQHIHTSATCDDPGGILLNLDQDLSAPNEGAPRGSAYPQTGGDGRLEYEAARAIDDLASALGPEAGQNETAAAAAQQPDTAAIGDAEQRDPLAHLDLGERVVNLHGTDMQAIACGPLERTQQMAGDSPTSGT